MNSSSNVARLRAVAVLALFSALTGGCYLLESARGQLSLMSKREPIARVLDRPSTSPELRTRLVEARAIRDFASRELFLPDNGSYRSYVDIGRPYVVWNVVAAPEFSVDAKQWCYPIVGCVAYRGYFTERAAQSFARGLRARGLDVSVGGVAAYSTLGHFDDPILSTMVDRDDIELAGIVFHELTHQLLYVSSDASFNEALATTVETEGLRRWLLARGRQKDLSRHEVQQARYLEVVELLRRASAELRVIYASDAGVPVMRERKAAAFGALRMSYAALKANWPGHAPFESWFQGEINNAHLASIATYYDCVPGFQRELLAAGGDLHAFYRRVRELAALPQAVRDAAVCR